MNQIIEMFLISFSFFNAAGVLLSPQSESTPSVRILSFILDTNFLTSEIKV